MKKIGNNIKIQNETMGCLLNETFYDEIQFKIFLKMINGSFSLENDLFFYNGDTFLINIPFNILKNSVVVTSTVEMDMVEPIKSKIEAFVTK
jgi:hypothetical protein